MNSAVRSNMNALVVAAKVRNSANIALSSGTWTGLNFDTEDYDIDNMHSTAANSSRLTCITPGLYEFGFDVWFSTSLNQIVHARVVQGDSSANGTYAFMSLLANDVNLGPPLSAFGRHTLSSAQYLTAQVYVYSTATIVAQSNWSPVFWAKWLSAT